MVARKIWFPHEPEVRRELAEVLNYPSRFRGFIEVPLLSDGVITLRCTKKVPADPRRGFVPAYFFAICLGEEPIGMIDLRIGYTENLYYGGNIGYSVDAEYRGNGYAARACRLVVPVARAHGMTHLIITNDPRNNASRRVCEKIGAELRRTVALPEHNPMRHEGHVYENIFIWDIEAFARETGEKREN